MKNDGKRAKICETKEKELNKHDKIACLKELTKTNSGNHGSSLFGVRDNTREGYCICCCRYIFTAGGQSLWRIESAQFC